MAGSPSGPGLLNPIRVVPQTSSQSPAGSKEHPEWQIAARTGGTLSQGERGFRREFSNAQLLEEGVAAVFTVHGTIAHEYAYMGIPVVNAGDNLHSSFDFNLHPKTLAEFKDHVVNANNLKVTIRKEEIEQFCYLHFSDQFRVFDGSINHPQVKFLTDRSVKDAEFFRHVLKYSTPETDRKVREHYEAYMAAGMDGAGRIQLRYRLHSRILKRAIEID